MQIDHDGLEVLDRQECLRLLDGARLGHMAVTSGALPVVLPVGYAMDGESIVVETGGGATLDSATAGAVVAFEVDNFHEQGQCRWTVMVIGVVQEVPEGLGVEQLRRLLGDDGEERHQRFIRISSELISGRRTYRAHGVPLVEARSATGGPSPGVG